MMEYLSFFVDAYLFFFIPKFSYSHKVQLVNPKKVYCINNGLIETSVITNDQSDTFIIDEKKITTLPFHEWALQTDSNSSTHAH